jgi:hypothetical protein
MPRDLETQAGLKAGGARGRSHGVLHQGFGQDTSALKACSVITCAQSTVHGPTAHRRPRRRAAHGPFSDLAAAAPVVRRARFAAPAIPPLPTERPVFLARKKVTECVPVVWRARQTRPPSLGAGPPVSQVSGKYCNNYKNDHAACTMK